MPFALAADTSSTQVNVVYADLATALTAAGWVEEESGILSNADSITWNVWRNPLANSGLSKDAYLAFGRAVTGTGGLFMKGFEDWNGDVNLDQTRWECMRPCPNVDIAAAEVGNPGTDTDGDDGYGDYFGFEAPFPYAVGPTGEDPNNHGRVGGDDSVGTWYFGNYTSGGAPTHHDRANTALDEAPHTFDFRSIYVGAVEVNCDDPTAIEYFVYADNRIVTVACNRINADEVEAMTGGTFDSFVAGDFPWFVMEWKHSGVRHEGSFSRSPGSEHWTTAVHQGEDPDVWATSNGPEWFSIQHHGFETDSWFDEEIAGDSPTFNPPIDQVYGGPKFQRVALQMGNNKVGVWRGLVTNMALNRQTSPSNPDVSFGDEVTINGEPYVFLGERETNQQRIVPRVSDGTFKEGGVWCRKV